MKKSNFNNLILQAENIRNIVVIQTAFIGDTALSLFFCNGVKSLFPQAKIIFICTPISYDLINNCEIIDVCFPYDKRNKSNQKEILNKLINDINEFNPDIIFSLHRSIRTSILVKNIRAKYKIGFKNSAFSAVYDFCADYHFCNHETIRNNELLKLFNNDIKVNYSSINFKSEENFLNIFDKDKKTIYVSPGSIWATKQWLPEYFNQLCIELEKLNYNIIIGGSKSEKILCDIVAKNTSAKIIAGEYKLNDAINIIKNCDLVICNDSAATHLASLSGTKCLTIYGATNKIFGFFPVSDSSGTIKNTKIKCSPCAIHGENSCPLKHFKCMRELYPEQVLEKAIKMLR